VLELLLEEDVNPALANNIALSGMSNDNFENHLSAQTIDAPGRG
jgi:hypothetical protein